MRLYGAFVQSGRVIGKGGTKLFGSCFYRFMIAGGFYTLALFVDAACIGRMKSNKMSAGMDNGGNFLLLV